MKGSLSSCRTVGLGILFSLNALLLPVMTASGAFPFSDDFESGLANWSTSGTWNVSTEASRSPTHSASDSIGTFYTNNTDASLTMASPMNLSTAVRPAMSFFYQTLLEEDYDYLYVEISTNGGLAWTQLDALTGAENDWTRSQQDLLAYAGKADVRVRFRLVTDTSVVMDGVKLDDIAVAEAPAAVIVYASSTNPTSTSVSWTPSADPTFRSYEIYRSLSSNLMLETAYHIGPFGAATTSLTDIAVSPKTKYWYQVMVMNSNNLHSLSPVASATTPAGMDYPFLDNGEGGTGMWIADPRWALSSESAYSGAKAWSDSPGGDYSNNMNSALRLSSQLDLTGSQRPVLSFNHRYHLLSGDSALAEVSTNNGASWITLSSYSNVSSDWRRARFDLTPYKNTTAARIRFRITTDGSGTADGWHVDDISVAEKPDQMGAPVLSEVQSHSMRVSWGMYTNQHFSHYAVFRSTTPGAGINSTLVTSVYDIATTTCVDTGLALDTIYYYRVYAVNLWGTFSDDSALESQEQTLNNPAPFTEDFEGSLESWNFTGSWAPSTDSVHGGTYSLTESPGANYTNNAYATAQTAVDLSGSAWPVLEFYDRYDIAGGDWGWVEIAPEGSGWTRVYTAAGEQTNWTRQVIDLVQWKAYDNVRLRFVFDSDGSTTSDGWAIDDVVVREHTPQAMPYPFKETFEDGMTNWIAGGWQAQSNT
ncbi:MAG: immune inhibitor A, partial [Verrucomicrobia bacterium]|nr:immune inhibitor A [Verrucomicrobiota bacterium]